MSLGCPSQRVLLAPLGILHLYRVAHPLEVGLAGSLLHLRLHRLRRLPRARDYVLRFLGDLGQGMLDGVIEGQIYPVFFLFDDFMGEFMLGLKLLVVAPALDPSLGCQEGRHLFIELIRSELIQRNLLKSLDLVFSRLLSRNRIYRICSLSVHLFILAPSPSL